MERVFLISADDIEETGTISWKYFFESEAPYETFAQDASYFGFITLREKPANHLDPFRLMRGEPGSIGPDGHKRWNINIMKAKHGLVVGMGCDEGGEDAIIKELNELDMPGCVLLTHNEALPALQRMFEGAGAIVTVFNFEGTLSTN